jgi:hypothetical protein
MVSSVSEENAHCIFRSSIGQYCAELPGRFIVSSIYSFLAWLIMFFFLLLPFGYWSMLLMVLGVGLFVHVTARWPCHYAGAGVVFPCRAGLHDSIKHGEPFYTDGYRSRVY